jgi:hypothetical protein
MEQSLMPEFASADVMTEISRLRAEVRGLCREQERLKIVLSILLRRDESAQTVITAEEMTEFSPQHILHSYSQQDGGLRLWVTDERAEPGSAG